MRCFDEVFAPLFPPNFEWPRHARAGNLPNALGREMAVNYGEYMDTGLTAHAISYIEIEAGVSKYDAKGAWEAYDPGLTTLYEGHHDTRMSRKQWRFETGAEIAVERANKRDIIGILPVLHHLPSGSLKSASVQVLCERIFSGSLTVTRYVLVYGDFVD